MIALLAALALAAVLSLRPGDEDSTIPQVSVAPQLRIGLDDAIAVTPGRQLAIAPAHLAGVEGPRLATSVATGTVGGPGLRTGVASAQVVTAPVVPRPPDKSPQSPPAEVPYPPQTGMTPVAVPVPAPAPASSPPPAAAPTRPPSGSQPPGPDPAGGPGPIGEVVSGPVRIYEGDEYVYSLSFYIQPEIYRAPGEENMILRVGDELDQSHGFGLQLWDDGSGSQRGLWASGEAMDGERFLAAVAEGAWHQVVLYFQASSEDDGLYMLLLDGQPIDTRAWISLIDSAGGYGLLEAGLFREGERVASSAEIYFGPTRLGETLEPVIP